MRLFGLNITREKAAPGARQIDTRQGWLSVVREPFSGAWQRNVEVDQKTVLAFHAVFACMTLIAGDIAKLRVKLMALQEGVWSEVSNPAYSPVLRRPNRFQTRNQFWETWILSKLARGNTYALKERDARGVVKALYILDPARVRPLVTPDGSVYYELCTDNLARIEEPTIVVPAAEIMHDRFNCLFHPLVGLSPIYACGLAATQGLQIQNNSTRFFANGSKPGGLLIAPGKIDDANALRLKDYWDNNFSGENAGKIAVLGDGLKYEALAVNADDAQLIEQLKLTAEIVCSTFHVPPYKIGVGALPSYNNVQALNVEYYSQCLQSLIEAIETCLDEGLGTGEQLGTEFDIDNLLRMDGVTQMQVLKEGAGILKIDEMRAKLDKKPTEGGDAVYLQQQNYSLAALAKRDAAADPFGTSSSAAATPDPAANDNVDQVQAAKALLTMMKGLPGVRR
ncbi:phage portal protein [Novosphingobium fluoreni]|uniref:phage portal protein n=1 Tax=Novosphingobium fluoreni TaxID=1391222 RepID=UPI003DA04842